MLSSGFSILLIIQLQCQFTNWLPEMMFLPELERKPGGGCAVLCKHSAEHVHDSGHLRFSMQHDAAGVLHHVASCCWTGGQRERFRVGNRVSASDLYLQAAGVWNHVSTCSHQPQLFLCYGSILALDAGDQPVARAMRACSRPLMIFHHQQQW